MSQVSGFSDQIGTHTTRTIVIAARLSRRTQAASTNAPGRRCTPVFDLHVPILGEDPYGYWRALNDHWGHGRTIVNVEHDVEFSDRLVQELVDCPHPLCTYAYRVYIQRRGYWIYAPTRDGKWIAEGDEWADTASLGFTKIAASEQGQPLDRLPWKWLEHAVCGAVAGTGSAWDAGCLNRGRDRAWHVHWPEIGHYHDYDAEAVANASEFERFCLEVGVESPLVMPSKQPTVAASLKELSAPPFRGTAA
jgi:hypothetical protein